MKERKKLIEISPRAWTHPEDKAAFDALKNNKALDSAISAMMGFLSDKTIRLTALASSARVSETQHSRLFRILKEACEILDIKKRPECFVSLDPFLNAGVLGVQEPILVINSTTLDIMSDDELLFVVGHELGHIASGQAPYKTLAWFLLKLSSAALSQIPIGALVLQGLSAALNDWERKAELSADRAGLLVAQNPMAAYNALMKIAGGAKSSELDINEFYAQARDYDASGDAIATLFQALNMMNMSHPFPVRRLVELSTWEQSGEYGRIVEGAYLKRDSSDEEALYKGAAFKQGGDSGDGGASSTQDPFERVASALSEGFGDLKAKAEEFLKRGTDRE